MKIEGLRRFDMMRRPAGDEVEFVTIMEFDSLDAVKQFAGEDYEQCYVPAEARALLQALPGPLGAFRAAGKPELWVSPGLPSLGIETQSEQGYLIRA